MTAPEPDVEVIDEMVGGFKVKPVPAFVNVIPVITPDDTEATFATTPETPPVPV